MAAYGHLATRTTEALSMTVEIVLGHPLKALYHSVHDIQDPDQIAWLDQSQND